MRALLEDILRLQGYGVLTAADLPDIRAGAVRWLAKPFTPGELLDAVRAMLGR